MDVRFENFFNRLIGIEKGYVNDKYDKGGKTKYGISKKSYPDEDIENLTLERAMQIYYMDYYLISNIHKIDDARIAWQIFDFGVTSGPETAVKMVQRIIKAKVDGKVGPETLRKINEFKGLYPLYIYYMSARLKFYISLTDKDETQLRFLLGWILRAIEV